MPEQTYEQAIKELQEILKDIQGDHTPISDLAEKAKRAQELIQFCKDKLRHVETDIQHLFEEEPTEKIQP